MKNNLSLEAGYFPEIGLLGIVTPLRPYKLTWILNKTMALNLAKDDDLLIATEKESLLIVGYSCHVEYNTYRLLKNKCLNAECSNKPYLLPEFKAFDYIFLVEGASPPNTMQEMVEEIKAIEEVSYAKHIFIDQVKTTENLFFS